MPGLSTTCSLSQAEHNSIEEAFLKCKEALTLDWVFMWQTSSLHSGSSAHTQISNELKSLLQVSSALRKEYLKRIKWYQRHGDNGEFTFDFVSACDLLCWARDNFDRNGDRYPGENPDRVVAPCFCLLLQLQAALESYYVSLMSRKDCSIQTTHA